MFIIISAGFWIRCCWSIKTEKEEGKILFWPDVIKKDERRNISNSYSFKLSSLCTFYYTE